MSTNSIILVEVLLVIGFEPILCYIESDFKSDVSTNSTKRANIIFLYMAQFDPLIIFSLIWSLLLTIFLYYLLNTWVAPELMEIKKFRGKKLYSVLFHKFFLQNLKMDTKYSYVKAIS